MWVLSEHFYRPISLSVPKSLSLSCASLMCNCPVYTRGCELSTEFVFPQAQLGGCALHLLASIHISCRWHPRILVCLMHIQSLLLARLTANSGYFEVSAVSIPQERTKRHNRMKTT